MSPGEPVAITGIGCRFPGGAESPEAFWQLLKSGIDAVGEVPADRWNPAAYFDARAGQRGKSISRRGGFLRAIDRFDAGFFGISPREAAFIDPQHRLLLQTAWEALEDAGEIVTPHSSTGVFVGISTHDYAHLQTAHDDYESIDIWSATGGATSIAANRISYCLGLRGPSVAVDTACSSALVAVHFACESLRRKECRIALAGGVNALLFAGPFIMFSRSGMLSPDGLCHAFDARANGFVRAEGAGVVVLKPLSDALANGDLIYAVIRGTAVNQDGRTPGLTMPSRDAQSRLLREACLRGGITPGDIQYVEAHGTGTAIGDPIEAAALGEVLREGRNPAFPCLIGSVKTNIGHLEAGAGIAGLIKTALSLSHREIPPSLHFHTPNPAIDFTGLGLRVVTSHQSYRESGMPPIAGVNSFGFGGANAHAVLQAHGTPQLSRNSKNSEAPLLLALSARSHFALKELAAKYTDLLTGGCVSAVAGDGTPADVAYSAGAFRTHHSHRLGVAARDLPDLRFKLQRFIAGTLEEGVSEGGVLARGVVFVFSGQGPQWWGMGRELFEHEPVFRAMIEKCDGLFRKFGKWSLIEELHRDENTSRLSMTVIAQPAIFALQMGLVALWESWGIRASAIVGHSVGEAAAACTAGVLSIEEAARVILERGRCMDSAGKTGRMLAVGLSENEATELLADRADQLCIGAINGPRSVVISGDATPLESLAAELEARGIFLRWLQVNYAFHSHQMEPVREELLRALGRVRVASATTRLISTVTGVEAGMEDFRAEYWWRNVRQPVRFAAAIQGLLSDGYRTFLEIGPHPVLSTAIRECGAGGTLVLPSLRRGKPERLDLLGSLGALYAAGSEIRWRTLYPSARRVRLPSYAWQMERHWHEAPAWEQSRIHGPDHPLLAMRADSSTPTWRGTLDLDKMPFLSDHQVNGQVIFPAAGFLDAALAVASAPWAKTLTDIDIRTALPLAHGHEPLRFELAGTPEEPGFRISTRQDSREASWICHTTGRFARQEPGEPSGQIDLEALKTRCTMEVPSKDVYEAFRRSGLLFGPHFRGIERVWRRDGEALGRVALPAGLAQEGHFFHPALLDSCLQVFAMVFPEMVLTEREFEIPLFLPVHVDRIRCLHSPSGAVWSHAVLVQRNDRVLIGDIRIFDKDGNLLVEVSGYQCLAVARNGAPDSLEDTFYQQQWKSLSSRSGPTTPPAGSREWIILGNEAGLGRTLASELAAKGDRAFCVDAGSASPEGRNPLDQIFQNAKGKLYGVIHLCNLDFAGKEPDEALLQAAKGSGWFSLVPLVQALGESGMEPRLLVVTRGAQAIRADDSACVLQAGALGLARVVTNEYRRFQCRLVDLDPADSALGLEALLEEIEIADSESEVAWRYGERYGARMVRSAFSQALRDHCPPPNEEDFRMEFDRRGGRGPLMARPVPRTAPGPGEIEVDVEAVGLNFRDLMKSLGIYPGDNNDLPGDEFAGRIVAIGQGVEGLAVGDAVLAMEQGSFRSRITLPAAQVFRVPSRLTCPEAATVPVAFVTAWYALHDLGRIQRGETILIHAAAGGVGLAAIQVALLAGATVFATAGNPEKREFIRTLGVKYVMDSRTLAFADEVRTFTGGRGVDLVLNSLAGEAIGKGLGVLAPGGRFLEIGKRDIYQNAKLELRPFRHSLSFFAIDLAQVAPERIRSLLANIMERMESGDLSPLPFRSFEMSRAEDAFQQMSRALHIGKLVLRMDKASIRAIPEPRPVVLRENASYLITGGLSGLGLAVAEWMVQNGARHLVLASRRGPEDPAAEEVSARLRGGGAEVRVLKVDVSVADEVRCAVESLAKTMPPVRGIVHSAMIIEDKTIAGLGYGSFQRVLAPKCDGAWNLHALGLPLDFFVMCSSVVSLLGSAGQGSYAAANSFLDSLADYRRSCGFPALTINWGMLGEIGYVSRNRDLKASLESSGLSGLRPDEATSALGRLLGSTIFRAGIAKMNWEQVALHNSSLSASARYENLFQATEPNQAAESSPFRVRFDALPADKRTKAILSELREQLAFVLRTSPSSLDDHSPLDTLGLDSLMAIELTSRIEKQVGMRLSVGTIHSASTLARIAERLCEGLNGPASICLPADHPAPEPSLNVVVPARIPDSFLEQARGTNDQAQATWLHQVESVALRALIALLGKGDLASAHRRLHRLMPLSKILLRRDWLWTDRNLSLVFGDNLSPAERARLGAIAFENHLRSYLEGLRAADYACDFHNSQHLLDAMAGGRGVILCGVHLGTWEPVFRIVKQVGVPVVCVYRRAQNPISNRLFQKIRAAYQVEWIERSDVAGIARALDEKKVVALMTDINTLSGGLQADFLGIPAMCPAGPAKLAMIKNCPLVPALALRAPGGRVDVHIEPPIYPGDELPAELTRRLNAVFEPWILEYAEQYNWLHPRWRARPDGASWNLKASLEQLLTARKFPCYEPSLRIRSLLV